MSELSGTQGRAHAASAGQPLTTGSGDGAEVAVAVAQFGPVADAAANLASIARLARRAAARGARLIVFPEYSNYFARTVDEHTVAAAEPLDGPFVSGLAAIARELRVHLVAGLLERSADDPRPYNTVVALGPNGERVAVYRKLHLYDAFGATESRWVAPGPLAPPQTFAVAGLTVALQTCYDLRFPEVTRLLADAGAHLVACPADWVRGPLKEHHWQTLVAARALENVLYVAAADHTPPSGIGMSMIVDPMGVALATLAGTEDVALAWLSPARVEQARAANPALALRRFAVVPRD